MIQRMCLGGLVSILLLGGPLSPTMADEFGEVRDLSMGPSIELEATEITESLKNIVGSFKLEEMEIIGSRDQPQFNYILRWQDPVPFPDEEQALSRNLIDPYYAPLDSERYRQMIDITLEE